jgi:hypothetical protein
MTSRCETTGSKAISRVVAGLWLAIWSFGGASLAAAQTSADDDGARIRVNCDAGQTIGRALQRARPGATIRVRGTCRERVVVTTDRITLNGGGSAVLDGGGSQGAVQAAALDPEFDGVVIIDGTSGVTLTGFTVQNGSGNGIIGRNGAAFAVHQTTVQDNAHTGIAVTTNSTAELIDCTLTRNRLGLDVFTTSSAILRGTVTVTLNATNGIDVNGTSTLELRGANLDISQNKAVGLVAGSACVVAIFGFDTSQNSVITANANGDSGIVLASDSNLVVFGSGPNTITATNHANNGIWLPGNGSLVSPFGAATFVVQHNATGMNFGQESSAVIVGGLQVTNNNVAGMLADGAGTLTLVSIPPNPSSITGNGTDVDLRFGSRTTIAGVAIGTLVCDGTVLSRGTTVCP